MYAKRLQSQQARVRSAADMLMIFKREDVVNSALGDLKAYS